MADSALQEVEIPLLGHVYRVRPEYRILTRIEAITQTPCRELGIRAFAGGVPMSQRGGIKELGLSDVVILLGIILSGDPEAPKTEDLGERLVEEGGYMEILEPLGQFLTRAVKGNKDYEREIREKAEAAKKEGRAQDVPKNPPKPAKA